MKRVDFASNQCSLSTVEQYIRLLLVPFPRGVSPRRDVLRTRMLDASWDAPTHPQADQHGNRHQA